MANDNETNAAQRKRMGNGEGFIAALDQSGGSTPKALALYGVQPQDYSGDTEMFAQMQAMRARIMQAEAFTSTKVLGAILFERTMGETVSGKKVPDFLWSERGVVPFLKIDKGLLDEENGVQLMKPIPDLPNTIARARSAGIFGTKERSVIQSANAAGIATIVAQQFEVAKTVCDGGLVPIIEPEVNIHSETKSECEQMLKEETLRHLDALEADVMLKLTIPNDDNLYDALADHPRVLRVVALSGGYSTVDACARLSRNGKMIASFSRALTEGLDRSMRDAEFEKALGENIDQIYRASI